MSEKIVEKKKILLRLDGSLYEELRHWADDELRSINSQIEYILRDAIRKNRSRILK